MEYYSETEDIYDVNPTEDNHQEEFHLQFEDIPDIHVHHGYDNVQSHSSSDVESMMEKLNYKINHAHQDNSELSQIHFGAKYTDAEIDKMKSDVNMAEHEMNSRKSDVANWESKVSLNDTKEHRANGDYSNAVRHLNEAKSQYNNAVSRYNNAVSKLNNAR